MEFSCENLPDGLQIDKSTGIIRGKPVAPIVIKNLRIHVSCTIGPDIKIIGDSNEFTITILSIPTKLELDEYSIENIDAFCDNIMDDTDPLTLHIKTDTDIPISENIIFENPEFDLKETI